MVNGIPDWLTRATMETWVTPKNGQPAGVVSVETAPGDMIRVRLRVG
jgi:hypothetical protein